jgi:hypothetical protein
MKILQIFCRDIFTTKSYPQRDILISRVMKTSPKENEERKEKKKRKKEEKRETYKKPIKKTYHSP